MVHFIKRTVLFFLPLIVLAIFIEFSIRQIPNDYSYKRKFLDSNSNKIETIILGSSHAYYGVNPDFFSSYTFNASHVAQTLELDLAILNKYKNEWENLENIIIPIDYFSLFKRLSIGSESWRTKNYRIYYKINSKWNEVENYEILNLKFTKNLNRVFEYYVNDFSFITCTQLGFGAHYDKKDLNKTGIRAAKRHTNSDKTNLESNVKSLLELIEFAKKNNTKILFFTSPAYHTYVSNLDKNQLDLTINTIKNLVNNNSNCYYYNFLEDASFEANDFMDADHLNKNGAKKLSFRMNDILSKMNKN